MRLKGMKDLATFRIREAKRAAAECRGKRRVRLRRKTVRVKVKSKVIPTGFLKIKGRRTFVGVKDQRKRNG